jgi:hypothetical protein
MQLYFSEAEMGFLLQTAQDPGRRHFSAPSNSNVRQIPFQWNLSSVLDKSHKTEIFFAAFIQSLSGQGSGLNTEGSSQAPALYFCLGLSLA